MWTRVVLTIASVAALAACSEEDQEPTTDPALNQLEAWRAEQTKQECPDVKQDETALNLVRSAQASGDVSNVHGEDDPYDRVTPVLDHLWSRPNPSGEGVIVTAARDDESEGLDEATRSRHRAVWLVLDRTIYPLNVDAAGAHGLLASGLPPKVAQRSGLSALAIDTERELGIEDYISFRWHGSENPLPVCN